METQVRVKAVDSLGGFSLPMRDGNTAWDWVQIGFMTVLAYL